MMRLAFIFLVAIFLAQAVVQAAARSRASEPADQGSGSGMPVAREFLPVGAPPRETNTLEAVLVPGVSVATSQLPSETSIVSGSNRGPEAVPDVFTTPTGTSLVVSVPGHLGNDFDPDGDTITWISYSAPANGSISSTTTDGGFTFTPDPGFSGLEELDYTIIDGNGGTETSKILILVVDDQNRAPLTRPDVFTTPRDTPLVVLAPGHLGNDFDQDGDQVTWISYSVPANGSISGTTTDGSFTFTPNPGFSGLEELGYTITDGNGGIDTGALLILVLPPEGGSQPVAVPDAFTMPQDESLTVAAPGHLANDFDPNGDTITWVSYSFPPNGSVSGTSAEGGFTYTPDTGFSGLDEFNYTISDGNGGTDTSKMLMRVLDPQNRAPVAVPDVFTTAVNASLQVAAPGHLLNDFDRDADTISWISYSLPSNGSISGTGSDGSFTYTPDPGFSGLEELDYSVTDGEGGIATSRLLIRVLEHLPDPVFDDGFEGD